MNTEDRIKLLNPTKVVQGLDTLEANFLAQIRGLNRGLCGYIGVQVKRGVKASAVSLPRTYRLQCVEALGKCLMTAESMARAQANYEATKAVHLARTELLEGDQLPAQFAASDLIDQMIPNEGLKWYKDYSLDLVATHEEATLQQVRLAIQKAVKQGMNTQKAMKEVAKALDGASGYYLERVVRTEVAKVYEQGRIKEFEANEEVVGYELSAILDSRVCEACRSREGVQIHKDQLAAHRLTPPFHPFCRCVFLPVFGFEDDAGQVDWKPVPDDAPPIPKGFGYKDMHIPGATLGPSPETKAKTKYFAKKAAAKQAKAELDAAEKAAVKASKGMTGAQATAAEQASNTAIDAAAKQAQIDADLAAARNAHKQAIDELDAAQAEADKAIADKLAAKEAKIKEAKAKWYAKKKDEKLTKALDTMDDSLHGVPVTKTKLNAAKKLIGDAVAKDSEHYKQVFNAWDNAKAAEKAAKAAEAANAAALEAKTAAQAAADLKASNIAASKAKWYEKQKKIKLENAMNTVDEHAAGKPVMKAKLNAANKLIAKHKLENPGLYDDVAKAHVVKTAAQVVPEVAQAVAKVADSVFPANIDSVTTVKNLGGSTGAKLVKDPKTGNLFVMKAGKTEGHLLEECYADAAYKAAGVNVPDFMLYDTPAGKYKLSVYMSDAKPLSYYKGSPQWAELTGQIQKDYVADAIMGDWDVVGLGYDNVMVKTLSDGSLKAFRIDNGGSFRYRAQGALKTADQWNDFPDELWTLQNKTTNPSAANVFDGLSWQDIRQQASDIYVNKAAILETLPEDLKATVEARIDNAYAVTQNHDTVAGAKEQMESAKACNEPVIKYTKPAPGAPKLDGGTTKSKAAPVVSKPTVEPPAIKTASESQIEWKPKMTAPELKKWQKGTKFDNDFHAYLFDDNEVADAGKGYLTPKLLPKNSFGTGIPLSFEPEGFTSHKAVATVKVHVTNPLVINKQALGEADFGAKMNELHDKIADLLGKPHGTVTQAQVQAHMGTVLKQMGHDGIVYIDGTGKKRLYVYDKQNVVVKKVTKKPVVKVTKQPLPSSGYTGLKAPVNVGDKAKAVKLPGQTVKGKFLAFTDANKGEMDTWFEGQLSYDKAKEAFTQPEFNAIVGYTGNGSGPINRTLRSQRPGRSTVALDPRCKQIEAAMNKPEARLKVDTLVYRSFNDDDKMTSDWLNMVGQTYHDQGFWSTGLRHDMCVSWGGHVKARILAPKGTRAIPVRCFSGCGHEQEIILSNKCNFRVIDAEMHGNDVWVNMEIIGEVE